MSKFSSNACRNVLEQQKISLKLSDAARELLAREGYDPVYGARPLRRTIQRLVLDPLAMRVLQGEFKEGDRVRIDVKGNTIVFVKEQPVTA